MTARTPSFRLSATACVLALALNACSDAAAPAKVGSVAVSPGTSTVIAGASTQLTAEVKDDKARVLTGREVTWGSSNTSTAVVSLNGTVTGVAPGLVTITATSEGKSGTAQVQVNPVPVATVQVQPGSVTLDQGSSQAMTVFLRDANNVPITGRTVTWSTNDGNIATVTTNGVISGVNPGTTTVTATCEGKSASVSVEVRPFVRDFNVFDAQFNQAAQAGDGSIPVVIGGNGAVVNVLLTSNLAGLVQTKVVLRLFNAAGVLVRADTVFVNTVVGTTATYTAPAAQFLLPPEALVAGLRWQVVRDPQGLVPDGNAATDVFPRGGTPAVLSMVTVPTLKVRFVPIVLTAHANVTGNVNAGNVADYIRTLESIFPLATIQTFIGDPFATSLSFGTPPAGGSGAFWEPLLGLVNAARLASADPSEYWVGVVLVPPGFNSVLSGGVGYVGLAGDASTVLRRTTMVMGFTPNFNPAFTRETVAHELGHNFGRRHAPCADPGGGVPADPDPLYPYAGGFIGLAGYDVRSWMAGRSVVPILMQPTRGDIMGYCSQNWVSDYTYRAVLTFRGSVAAARSAESRALSKPVESALVIRGTVEHRRGVTLEPAMLTDMRVPDDANTGSYRIEGRAADGRLLFTRNVEPSVIDHAPDIGHISVAVPATPAMHAALATIEVRGPAGSFTLARPVGPRALRAAADMAPRRRAAGGVDVSCEDSGARGILVRHANTGAVLATERASAARVLATSGTPLAVTCSDGVSSTRTTVITP